MISPRWETRDPADPIIAQQLARELGISQLLASLLVARGLTDPGASEPGSAMTSNEWSPQAYAAALKGLARMSDHSTGLSELFTATDADATVAKLADQLRCQAGFAVRLGGLAAIHQQEVIA
jgi:hypothetical protein